MSMLDKSPVVTSNGAYDPVLYNIQKDLGIRRNTGAKKLEKLSARHKKIIAMHLSCIPSNEIANLLNISYVTVSRILNDPLAQAEINNFDGMSRKEFDALRYKANSAIRDGLNDTNIQTRLRASDQFSKRAGDYHPKAEATGETAEDVIQRILNLNIQVNVAGGI